jgi:hypothetical protein
LALARAQAVKIERVFRPHRTASPSSTALSIGSAATASRMRISHVCFSPFPAIGTGASGKARAEAGR